MSGHSVPEHIQVKLAAAQRDTMQNRVRGMRWLTHGQRTSCALWTAGTPQQRDNGGIPANVFSMNLADRIKLSKGVRRLPMAYTMSGKRCLSCTSSSLGAILFTSSCSNTARE